MILSISQLKGIIPCFTLYNKVYNESYPLVVAKDKIIISFEVLNKIIIFFLNFSIDTFVVGSKWSIVVLLVFSLNFLYGILKVECQEWTYLYKFFVGEFVYFLLVLFRSLFELHNVVKPPKVLTESVLYRITYPISKQIIVLTLNRLW